MSRPSIDTFAGRLWAVIADEFGEAAARDCGCAWHGPDEVLLCAEHHQQDVRAAEWQARADVARAVAVELRWFALRIQPIVGYYDPSNRGNVNRWADARRLEVRAERLDPDGSWPSGDMPPTEVAS